MKQLKDLKPNNQLKEAFKILNEVKAFNRPQNLEELKMVWDGNYSHFNNTAPHRYESDTDFEDCCVYCLRPKNWRVK